MWSIVNHQPHPNSPFVEVFVFLKKDIGNLFLERLESNAIPFEKEEEEKRILVGVRRPHIQKAIELNNQVLMENKKPFISNSILKWIILIVTGGTLFLAFLGYFLSA